MATAEDPIKSALRVAERVVRGVPGGSGVLERLNRELSVLMAVESGSAPEGESYAYLRSHQVDGQWRYSDLADEALDQLRRLDDGLLDRTIVVASSRVDKEGPTPRAVSALAIVIDKTTQGRWLVGAREVDLAIWLATVHVLARLGVKYSYIPADDFRAAQRELEASGWLPTPLEGARLAYEPMWALFERAIDSGRLDPETERLARWLNKTIAEWWRESPDDTDLYELLNRRLLSLLPDAFAALGYERPPAELLASGENKTVLPAINAALATANTAIESAAPPEILAVELPPTPVPAEPRLARAVEKVNRRVSALLPALEANTLLMRRLAATAAGRAVINTSHAVTAVGASAATGSPVAGGAAAAGIALARVARYVLARHRLQHPETPVEPTPPSAPPTAP